MQVETRNAELEHSMSHILRTNNELILSLSEATSALSQKEIDIGAANERIQHLEQVNACLCAYMNACLCAYMNACLCAYVYIQ